MSGLFRKEAIQNYGRIYGKTLKLPRLRFARDLAVALLCAAIGAALALHALGTI